MMTLQKQFNKLVGTKKQKRNVADKMHHLNRALKKDSTVTTQDSSIFQEHVLGHKLVQASDLHFIRCPRSPGSPSRPRTARIPVNSESQSNRSGCVPGALSRSSCEDVRSLSAATRPQKRCVPTGRFVRFIWHVIWGKKIGQNFRACETAARVVKISWRNVGVFGEYWHFGMSQE